LGDLGDGLLADELWALLYTVGRQANGKAHLKSLAELFTAVSRRGDIAPGLYDGRRRPSPGRPCRSSKEAW
jgi:hypothetical protein